MTCLSTVALLAARHQTACAHTHLCMGVWPVCALSLQVQMSDCKRAADGSVCSSGTKKPREGDAQVQVPNLGTQHADPQAVPKAQVRTCASSGQAQLHACRACTQVLGKFNYQAEDVQRSIVATGKASRDFKTPALPCARAHARTHRSSSNATQKAPTASLSASETYGTL